MNADDWEELQRLRAMERYVGSVFDDWVGSVSRLMALYEPGLSWDDVLPIARMEISRARHFADQLAPEASDPCIGHYGTHGDHEDEDWLNSDENCALLDLLDLLKGSQ